MTTLDYERCLFFSPQLTVVHGNLDKLKLKVDPQSGSKLRYSYYFVDILIQIMSSLTLQTAETERRK